MTVPSWLTYGVLALSAGALVFSIHTFIHIRRSAKETIAHWKRAEESWKQAAESWRKVAEIRRSSR